MEVSEVAERIRRICDRLLDEPPATWNRYRSELKTATRELAAEQKAWGHASETDTHQDQDKARQSYRSREKDSADGFAEGMKLFKPRKRDSEKKKD